MIRIKEFVVKFIGKNVMKRWGKFRAHWVFYSICILLFLYLYGIVIHTFIGAMSNFKTNTDAVVFSLNPVKCISAVFSPYGVGTAFFIGIMYLLITQKWTHLITGVKVTKDERNFFTINEGTHGTSGWMNKHEMKNVLLVGEADEIQGPILGKLENKHGVDYIGLKRDNGLNKHILVYGASGSGKSRGFVKPFILKTAQQTAKQGLKSSMIIVDPKAEFYEHMSDYLRKQGYVVKAFNLLDMENSDGWNCIGETEGNADMVQSVAEVIIRNTADSDQKQDFWDKAEKNLLVALIHYVQTMKDPITGELLPIHERTLGAVYKMVSGEGQKSLDAKFQKLPMDHPARAPYGVFKQAASNLWGNIFIGLGSRLSVFQNKLVEKITSYHEIDLELPGKQPCAYFCIISDNDSSLEFLSSLFFSLMFKKLSDYARKNGDEQGRLPVEVNFLLDEFCNIGRILDFKKTLSVVRSRNINCQVIVQSAAQLADRYPVKEWQEIVGNADTQLVLGCNDEMTSEFISKRCGNITIQTTSSMSPQTPLFSPITREVNGYRQNKSNATRPLMYPEEILQMDNQSCLLMLRGQRPLKALKIIPDELADFSLLKRVRVTDYVPEWREKEELNLKKKQESKSSEQPSMEQQIAPVSVEAEQTTKLFGDVIPSSIDTEVDDGADKDDDIFEEDYFPPVSAQNLIDK